MFAASRRLRVGLGMGRVWVMGGLVSLMKGRIAVGGRGGTIAEGAMVSMR
jgi:hypothetical protein